MKGRAVVYTVMNLRVHKMRGNYWLAELLASQGLRSIWLVGWLVSYLVLTCGFGGLEVACWPFLPNFAGSNLTEAVGFFRAKNSSARLPSEGK